MDLEDTRLWTSCLDWFLQLPADRENALWRILDQQEKEDNVPFLSYPERKGLEQGLEKGRLQSLGWYLQAKHPAEAPGWLSAVAAVRDAARQEALCQRIFQAAAAADIHSLITAAGQAPGN